MLKCARRARAARNAIGLGKEGVFGFDLVALLRDPRSTRTGVALTCDYALCL